MITQLTRSAHATWPIQCYQSAWHPCFRVLRCSAVCPKLLHSHNFRIPPSVPGTIHSLACAAAVQPDVAADMDTYTSLWWPLLLSLLAGMSTSIGGLIAVTLSPDDGTLAFLLGTAIGVMATVSGVELWWHSAAQLQDYWGVTGAVLAGAALFAVLDPLLPSAPEAEELAEAQQPLVIQQAFEHRGHHYGDRAIGGHLQHGPAHHATSTAHLAYQPVPAAAPTSASSSSSSAQEALPAANTSRAAAADADKHDQQQQQPPPCPPPPHTSISKGPPPPRSSQHTMISHDTQSVVDAVVDIQQPADSGTDQAKGGLSSGLSSIELPPAVLAVQSGISSQASAPPGAHNPHHRKSLLRLSLLMGITMTLHNLPEGFAVAFSAFTDIAPVMVLAIGLHNIPEGLICAAPLYAATGSKWQAVGIATASGLSEPLGALLALLVFKPFVKSLAALDYVLAATGGIMLAVCVLELWPEGRRCGRDGRLLAGMLLGAAVMGWTLWIGV